MSLHIANLFKLNTLVQNVDFETTSLSTLKEHYTRIKSLQNNHKLLNSLPDKGEKYKIRLKHIEVIIRKRCAEMEKLSEIDAKIETNNDNNQDIVSNDNLSELLNKFQSVNIEKNKDSNEEAQSSNDNSLSKIVEDEKLNNDLNSVLIVKTEYIELKKEIKNEHVNYFSKTATKNDKINEQKRIKQIKEKVLKNIGEKTKYPIAKSIPLNEAFILLKEHEKRVQEFQIQQAANKLLEGKTAQYDFSFAQKSNKIETSKYREPKNEINNDCSFSDSDGENDFFNDDNDDDDVEDDGVPKIDRLHFNHVEKHKFKLNEEDV